MIRKLASFLTLFTSFSTLICCALPALFVSLGFGAAFAGLIGNFPQLIWISEQKLYLFGFGGALLAVGGFIQWRSKQLACPIDPKRAEACESTRSWSHGVYFVSVGLYLIGAFFAFVAPRLLSG
jgi:hypothetical protein